MTKKKKNVTKGPTIRSARATNRDVKIETSWITVTCPTCKGTGKRGNGQCGLCEGAKTIKVPEEK